jgi:transcriptional regulator with XRE-family HTH domain
MEQHTATAARGALARNLRRLRVARRWSLGDLAAATGTGKATLSAIENGRANPTVETLATLAGALDVEAAALLETTPGEDLIVVRAGAAPRDGDGRERLGRVGERGGTIQRAAFAPASAAEHPPRPAGTRLHVVVTRGTLVAGPSGRPVELGVGDYLAFPADTPHEFSTARRGAEALMVVEGA